MLRIDDFQTVEDFLTEAYEVITSVEVVGRKSRKIIRIEVLKTGKSTFKCRYWQYEDIIAQPAYRDITDASGAVIGKKAESERYTVLVGADYPWVQQGSADLALSQALFFLRDAGI